MARSLTLTVHDTGGPVRGRLSVNASPGPHNGERAVFVDIGGLDLFVDGSDEIAATRCQEIAAEFHRMAGELLPQIGDVGAVAPRRYLGDGVYVAFDVSTLNVILTTEDGLRATNRIVLEPEVLDALGNFAREAIYARQRREPLDARAHAGDGDGAAREAGAVHGVDNSRGDEL